MSAETLKFFEDKSTESIINWMLTHLTEEQIRMCLDKSGIPDSSIVAAQPSEPGPSVPGPSVPGPSVPGPSVPGPSVPGPSVPDPSVPKKTAADIFTQKYRKKCYETQYLIKNVSREGVEYFEFKEVDEDDIKNNPELLLGEVNWVFKKEPISRFRDYCTEEDKEVLAILKEENMDKFINAPLEVLEVAREYVSSGLVSPIPLDSSLISPVPSVPLQISEPIIKAIKIQQTSSEIMKNDYPELYNRGLTMYPIFAYDSDGKKVKHLSVAVQNGKLTLVEDLTDQRLLNSKFKKVTNLLNQALISGVYNPPDNIKEELNQAIRTVNPDIPNRIKIIYDPEIVKGYTFFGTLSDDDLSLIDSDEVREDPEIEDVIYKKMETIKIKAKKPTDMSNEELKNWIIDTRGKQYFNEYEPIIYTNSLGFKNIKYVKRDVPLNKDASEEFEEIKYTPFMIPQGARDINSGPGTLRMNYDSDDELLF